MNARADDAIMHCARVAWRVGETVTIRYQPDAPEAAAINAFYSLWRLPLTFAVIGAFVVLLAGLVALILTLLRRLSARSQS